MNSNTRNLLILSALLTFAAQAQAALEDTSFTVTLPFDYDQAFFNATSATQSNVNASGQTPDAGFLNITNSGTGTGNETFFMNVTAALPTNVTLKANTVYNPDNAIPINNTALARIISNLTQGASQPVWLWADFINVSPINEKRNLTVTVVNSSTYI